jgi:hypothetical protein
MFRKYLLWQILLIVDGFLPVVHYFNTCYFKGAEQLLRGLEFDRCRLLAYAQSLDNRR